MICIVSIMAEDLSAVVFLPWHFVLWELKLLAMIFAQYNGTIKLEQITVVGKEVEKTIDDNIHQSVSCTEGKMDVCLQIYLLQ